MTDGDSTQPDSSALNFHTDMPVGEILRRTRVYYGQTLPQIMKDLAGLEVRVAGHLAAMGVAG